MASLLHTVIAEFETTLAAKIANGATTGTLTSATDKDGVALPTGTYTMICEPGTSRAEHLRFTLTGTAMTAIYSISRQGTATSGVQATNGHRAGSKMVLTDFVNLLSMQQILDGISALNGSSVLYYDSAPTFVSNNELITKKYADDLALSGAPDASTTVKGNKEDATTAEINSDAATGGTGATLAITPDKLILSKYGLQLPSSGEKSALVGTSGTPGSGNKFVTADDVAENTASKVVRRKSDSNITVPSAPTSSTDAVSKTWVEGKTIAITTSNTTVSNTTSETDILSVTVPGGTLGTTNGVHAKLRISNSLNQGSDVYAIKVKYGATTMITLSSILGGNNTLLGDIDVYLFATGATGTQECSMSIDLYTNLTTAGAGVKLTNFQGGTATEDSTADKTLAVTIQYSGASAPSANDTITVAHSIVRQIK